MTKMMDSAMKMDVVMMMMKVVARQCPYCMKVFSRKYDVIRHVNNSCKEAPRRIHRLDEEDIWQLLAVVIQPIIFKVPVRVS